MGRRCRTRSSPTKIYGELNADKSNAIVYPTWYSGQHYDNEWLIGRDRALDPARYFIIVPDMFGNGLSSSPSNTTADHEPSVSMLSRLSAVLGEPFTIDVDSEGAHLHAA